MLQEQNTWWWSLVFSDTSRKHNKSQWCAENIIHNVYLGFNPGELWKEKLSNKPVGVTIVLSKLNKPWFSTETLNC